MDRSNACFDESKSVIITIADACPCRYPNNEYSNQRWCCGDMNHVDLSREAFEQVGVCVCVRVCSVRGRGGGRAGAGVTVHPYGYTGLGCRVCPRGLGLIGRVAPAIYVACGSGLYTHHGPSHAQKRCR